VKNGGGKRITMARENNSREYGYGMRRQSFREKDRFLPKVTQPSNELMPLQWSHCKKCPSKFNGSSQHNVDKRLRVHMEDIHGQAPQTGE